MCKKVLKAGILAGIVITIVSFLSQYIVNLVWPYDVLSLGGMRAATDPIMLLFFAHPGVLALAMAYVFEKTKGSFKGDHKTAGKKFGLLMWIVVSIPSAFLVYTSMNYPIGFTVNSVIGSFFYMIAAGITIARSME